MKVHDLKIVLNKPSFVSGNQVTGQLVVKTANKNLSKHAKIFLKLYDKLDIEWIEDEVLTFGIVERSFKNLQKPFQLNVEQFLDSKNVIDLENDDNDDDDDFKFAYPFEFELPQKIQGTINIRNAKCQYFLKAYLSDDENVFKHYQSEVNVFDEFFKSLLHTYCKEEIIIYNPTYTVATLNTERHEFEAKSNFIKVKISLPKLVYSRGESIPVNIHIEPLDENSTHLELYKVSFKLFQVSKLLATYPHLKAKLFETLIFHSSRKHLHENLSNKIVLDELIPIPEYLNSSTSRSEVTEDQKTNIPQNIIKEIQRNQIRINYKLSFGIWRSFLVDDLDLNIPILIDPES